MLILDIAIEVIEKSKNYNNNNNNNDDGYLGLLKGAIEVLIAI